MQLTPRLKKILIIVGFVLMVILLGIGYYFVFFAPTPVPEEELININGELIPFSQLPDIVNANLAPTEVNVNVGVALPDVSPTADGGKTLTVQLGTDNINDMSLSMEGQEVVYYNEVDGKFYKIDAQGNILALSDVEYKDVEKVTWGNDANKAVLEFPDGSNIYYDFEADEQYTLPAEMEDFTFAPVDDQIGFKYIAVDEEDRWLGVANVDGSGARGLEQLGDNEDKVNVDWSPSGQSVATHYQFLDGDRQQVGFVGLKGENFKGTIVEGKDFRSQWSPDGQQLLYSVFNEENDFKPTLWVVDAYGNDIGKNRTEIKLNTWADKCSFSGASTVYCAVPSELERGAGFAPGVADQTPDYIYKIDINSGLKTLVAIPSNSQGDENYTIESLVVSEDGKTLYFKDKNSQKLNKIVLTN